MLAYRRWGDDGSQVAIVANFSDQFFKDYKVCNFATNTT
jgi:hypothetical protein